MLQQQAQELSEAHAEFRLLQAGFEFEEAVQVVNHHALDVPELVGVDLHALPLLIDRLAHQFGQRVAGLHRDINGQRVKAAPLVRRALQVDHLVALEVPEELVEILPAVILQHED